MTVDIDPYVVVYRIVASEMVESSPSCTIREPSTIGKIVECQTLIVHGDGVVVGGAKNLDAFPGQILVDLELHPAA
jgi:hypothetical protein